MLPPRCSDRHFSASTPMTAAHILFIPTLFLLGFLMGGLVGARQTAALPAQAQMAQQRISAYLLFAAFLLFVAVFVATHLMPLFGGSMALHHAMGGAALFDQRPSFSSAEVQQRLAGFGDLGRALYQRFTYSVDVAFPLSLLAFLGLLAHFVAERRAMAPGLRRGLKLLPLLWFGCDMLENAMVFRLLEQFPIEIHPLGELLGYVTVLKFGLLLASLSLPVLLTVLGQRQSAGHGAS
jgi:hypothetical protein